MVKEGGKNREHAPAITDERFSRLHTDPRFLRPNREEAKVIIDDRFKGLLTGKGSGKKKAKLDKYGRKTQANGRSGGDEEMRRLYRLEDGGKDGGESNSGSGSEVSSNEEAKGSRGGRAVDYARGEGVLESSDEESSEESSEEEEGESDSGEDDGEVTIGTASARRREKQRLRFAEELDEDEDEEDFGDMAAEAQELQVEEDDLAELDAQAERTVEREASAAKKSKTSPTAKRTGDTSRLAVVNMDWDHIRAIDLYKVFSSLVSPAGTSSTATATTSKLDGETVDRNPRAGLQIVPIKGRVVNVRVYPSNFGVERMKRENQEGPPRDIFKRDEDGRVKSKKKSKKSRRGRGEESEDSEVELFEVDEGGEFDEEALRNYQLERLRYYYAIVTFDTPQTARHVLDEIDGTEMERTANVFDLSFVPKDMTFPDKQGSNEDLSDLGWRDEATETSDGSLYKGVDFTTDALRHSKVKLTWDADDPQRSKITRQLAQEPLTVDNLRDEDFKAYLASDSEGSDDGADEEEGRDKMRSLLGLGGDGEGQPAGRGFGKSKSAAFEDGKKSRRGQSGNGEGEGDMEITFMPGLSEAAQRKKMGVSKETNEESTLDKYMRKQREKRERRKAQGKGEKEEEEEREELADGQKDARLGFDDPFFANDDGVDFEEALAAEQEGRGGKDSRQGKKKTRSKEVQEEKPREDEQAVVDSESGDDDAAGHFSIKDVMKAEQEANGKKSRWAKKKEKRNKREQEGREQQVQQNFAIDVQDERFQGVFNDHRFALDPSHPSFLKTKSMGKLMDERRKREKQQRRKEGGPTHSTDMQAGQGGGADLADLVQSVRKRSAAGKTDGPSKKLKARQS